MSAKQDAVYPRNAAALESQYNFGKSFAEMMGVATDAKKTAGTAKETADKALSAYEGLDQEQIFKLLTNDEEDQGVYRGENGKVYINADYLKSGKIAADLIDVANLIAERLQSISGTSSIFINSGLLRFVFGEANTISMYNQNLAGDDGVETGGAYPIIEMIMRNQESEPLSRSEFSANLLQIGGTSASPIIQLSVTYGKARLGINGDKEGKELYWESNKDGTYTLMGKD